MMRLILGGAVVAAFLIILFIPSLFCLAYQKSRPYRDTPGFTNACIKFLARLIAFLSGVKLNIRGQENIPKNAVYFAGNHQGYYDALVPLLALGSVKPIIAKKEIGNIPAVYQWMSSFGCVFLDRGNIRTELKSLKRVQSFLENGRSVAVFPEGTRSRGPKMAAFKPGAFHCAIKAKVPVVPMALDGSYKCYESQGFPKPGIVKVSILPPVSTDGKKSAELAAEVQDLIAKELNKMRAE